MKLHKIKVLKDYPMCGGMVIPKGTVLKLTSTPKPSVEEYVDKKGNRYTFDTSEIMFSGCFHNTKERLNSHV